MKQHPQHVHGHNSKLHGRSPTYNSWRGMIGRCLSPNHVSFERYGGRGITVCPRWREFANFLAGMGERPEGMTLERKDNNGNYEPGNCMWATLKQQSANQRRRKNERVYHGKTAREWAQEWGVQYVTAKHRLKRGVPPERFRIKPSEN